MQQMDDIAKAATSPIRDDLIKRAWQEYRSAVVPKNASKRQVQETRQAFYGGAAVLFYTIMRFLDPGEEPTDNDLVRMSALADELDAFGQEIDLRYLGGGTKH